MDPEIWQEEHEITPEKLAAAFHVLEELRRGRSLQAAVAGNPVPGGGYVAKHILVAAYKQKVASGEWKPEPALLESIRMKPVRTLSGVTTVTVLTKPWPCPGDCLFCPDDVRMPKSYLPDEPGAARAFQNQFDPFKQVASRLESYEAIGHPTDKIELLILGGTWDAYPREYQEWFVRRCFDALNGVDAPTLEEAQRINEGGHHRNVGLVIETRPDRVTYTELAWLRRLGVTKVQMGAQSLDDRILALNRRGHTTAETLRALQRLRGAGFKVVLHWMPNLLGATPESDRADFVRLWQEGYAPDEIKIYPTQLLEDTALYKLWQSGDYRPYTTSELISLVADLKPSIPEYCRVNRIIRDIPSSHVVAGNKNTSLRMEVLAELARRGQVCRCIRCREVRGQKVNLASLRLDDLVVRPPHSEEHFLSFVTADDHIAGYLRLSLPGSIDEVETFSKNSALPDLQGAALIREVHVYGQSLPVGGEKVGAAQHRGLGTALLKRADEIALESGFRRMAVIAAVGTRKYYEERGFSRGDLYMVKEMAAP